ncbi:hypothetical protein [Burkholderia lata]|uniref:hypothetical protein n=1 Tax=Burkholderia lata (strain ATCC 17760 / DSM 23089 / LMG 22485 / NCIMB 9086 / R18194 / 383) TaxID=482957 RepID=UPI001581E59D|nr:hypothetical protein [Burkholderia lata]
MALNTIRVTRGTGAAIASMAAGGEIAATFVIRRSPSGERVSHGSKSGEPPDGEIGAVAQGFDRRNRVIAR